MKVRWYAALLALLFVATTAPSARAQADPREFPPGADLVPGGGDPPCDQLGSGANVVCWCCVQAHTPEPKEGDPTTRNDASGNPIPAGSCALDCELACGANSAQDLRSLRASECEAQAGSQTVVKAPIYAECNFTGDPADRCEAGAPPSGFRLYFTRFRCESLTCKCPPRVVRTGCVWKRKHGGQEVPLNTLPLNALCSGTTATPCS